MYRIGAPFSIEALPMIRAVKSLANFEFEWYSWNDLVREFLCGKLDAVLVPPLIAVELPDSIVVPGVGISTRGKVPSPVLYTKVDIKDGVRLGITASYSYWKGWFDIVIAKLGLNYKYINIIENGKLIERETILAGIDEEDFSSQGYKEVNIGELWKKVNSDLPMVCWIWVSRKGVDYRQIRTLLGRVWEKAKENLSEVSWKLTNYPELVEYSDAKIEELKDIYYSVASAEVESIKWLLGEAKRLGLVSKEADFIMC